MKHRTKGGCRKPAGWFLVVVGMLLGFSAAIMLVDTVGSDEVMAELGILLGMLVAGVALIALGAGVALLAIRR